MNIKPLEAKVVRLLQTMEKHPELYKQSDQTYHRTARVVKQNTWDSIARTCGFAKTEDAKCRWRGLLIYFRQILEDVARKKVRRYIPNTNNPDDKYVQLSDWRYYQYIKFMEPHIKISNTLPDPRIKTEIKVEAPSTTTSMPLDQKEDIRATTLPTSPSILKIPKVEATETETSSIAEISLSTHTVPTIIRSTPSTPDADSEPKFLHRKVKIGNVVMDIEINSKTRKANLTVKNKHGTTTSTTLPIQMASPNGENEASAFDATDQFEILSQNDQNLKSYFDSMFKSVQRLPLYHQERVKEKLLRVFSKKNC